MSARSSTEISREGWLRDPPTPAAWTACTQQRSVPKSDVADNETGIISTTVVGQNTRYKQTEEDRGRVRENEAQHWTYNETKTQHECKATYQGTRLWRAHTERSHGPPP